VLGAEAVGGDGDKSGAATMPGDASLIERGLDSAAFVSLSGLLEDEFGDDVVGSVDDVMSLTTLDGLAAACAPFFASANGAAGNGTAGATLTTPGAVAAAEFARDPPRVPAKPLEISFVGEGKTMVSALEHVAGLGLVASGHVRVVEVYTNPGDRLVASAAAAADPGAVVRAYAELKGDAAAERFTAVDWLFSLNNAAVIVRAPVLRMCRGGAFNLHPGKLPEYAGLHVAQWAIRNGDTVSAATLHWMDPGLDTGDIAFEHEVAIEDDDTGLTLLNKCFAAGVACFLRCLNCALRNGAEAMPRIVQDASRRRLYRTKDAVDGRIDFANLTARQVRDFVRAADYGGVACPTYTPFHELDGEQVTDNSAEAQPKQVGSSLKAADVTDTQVVAPSGTVAGSVLASGAGGYLVACKDGGVVWIRKMK
jgi:methionyl-tRNA formyltransferase/acyl carrier protein